MPFSQTIQRLTLEVQTTFAALDTYFELPATLRQTHPEPEAWSMDEILEHITLTNHFLMLTLRNSRDKVLRRARTQPIPDSESDLDTLLRIGDPDAFPWTRPEHMEPTRQTTPEAVRQTLRTQGQECLAILSQISHGEGALHTVRMSVQNLGKLDMYQWLFFLVQHARRHIVEMDRIRQR